jgi:serine/threonine protein kinase
MPTQPEEPDPFIGQVLNSYRLEKKLGGGGMAAVYRATHILFSRKAAVKVLHRNWAREPDVHRRFETEARIAETLDHPNINKCIDFGFTPEGNPFAILELLEGEELLAKIKREGRLDLRDLRSLVEQVAEALEYVHARDIIHRDLKPENLFLVPRHDREELVKVLDFGIARVLGTARYSQGIVGTPQYLAPEQLSGCLTEVDRRCDVYSLAAVAYHCLTGRYPFEGETIAEILAKVCMDAPESPSVQFADIPVGLSELLMKALAKDREQRPGSAAEFAHEFNRFSIPPTKPIPSNVATEPDLLPTRIALRCVEGEKQGEMYVIEAERALIGRIDSKAGIFPEVELSLQEVSRPEITVSRQHAEISLGAEGFVVRDLGSFNGTQVNETKLEKGEPHRLTKGDRLWLGKIVLVVEEVS